MVFQFNPAQCCCNPCETWSDNFDRASIGGDWTVLSGSWSIVDEALETSDNGAEIQRAAGGSFDGATRLRFNVYASTSGDVVKITTRQGLGGEWLKLKFGTNEIEDEDGGTATVSLPVGEWVAVTILHGAASLLPSPFGGDMGGGFQAVIVGGAVAYHRPIFNQGVDHNFSIKQDSGFSSTIKIDSIRLEQLWDAAHTECLRPDHGCWPVGNGVRVESVVLTVGDCTTTGSTPEEDCDLLSGEYEAAAVFGNPDRMLFDSSLGLPGSGPGSWDATADAWTLALDGASGYDTLLVYQNNDCGLFAIMADHPDAYQPCSMYHLQTTGGASAANEVQRVALQGSPTGGTFTLTFDGQTTGTIAYNASAATVQAALEGLSNIGVGDVSVSRIGSFPYYDWEVTFQSALGNTNVPQMTGDGSSLTGGSSTDVTIWTTTQGSAPVGGTFTLTYDGQTTSGIAHNADGATTQAALESLSNIDVGDVYCYDDGSGGVYVRFAGALAGAERVLTIDDSGITGDGSPAKALSDPWVIVGNMMAAGALTWQSSSIDRSTNVVTLTGPDGDCDCPATLEPA